jgi:hypothetical protein
MALTHITGSSPASAVGSLALSTGYLGAGNYVQVQAAGSVDFASDDESIALTYKFSLDGGATFSGDFPLGAGAVYTLDLGKGEVCTVDVKAASGTPSLSWKARR